MVTIANNVSALATPPQTNTTQPAAAPGIVGVVAARESAATQTETTTPASSTLNSNEPAARVSIDFNAQITSLQSQQRSGQQFGSTLESANTGITSIQNDVKAIQTIVTQAQSTSLVATERAQLQQQVNDLVARIDRTAANTQSGSRNLLNGDTTTITLQTDAANSTQNNTQTSVTLSNLSSSEILSAPIDVSTAAAATSSAAVVTEALNTVSTQQSAIAGAIDSVNSTLSARGNNITAITQLQGEVQQLNEVEEPIVVELNDPVQVNEAQQAILAAENVERAVENSLAGDLVAVQPQPAAPQEAPPEPAAVEPAPVQQAEPIQQEQPTQETAPTQPVATNVEVSAPEFQPVSPEQAEPVQQEVAEQPAQEIQLQQQPTEQAAPSADDRQLQEAITRLNAAAQLSPNNNSNASANTDAVDIQA